MLLYLAEDSDFWFTPDTSPLQWFLLRFLQFKVLNLGVKKDAVSNWTNTNQRVYAKLHILAEPSSNLFIMIQSIRCWNKLMQNENRAVSSSNTIRGLVWLRLFIELVWNCCYLRVSRNCNETKILATGGYL